MESAQTLKSNYADGACTSLASANDATDFSFVTIDTIRR
jgi:hypothetical protein